VVRVLQNSGGWDQRLATRCAKAACLGGVTVLFGGWSGSFYASSLFFIAAVGIFISAATLVARDRWSRRQTKDELSAVYELAPLLILLMDDEYRVLKANTFAERFAECTQGSLAGLSPGQALGCRNAYIDPAGCGFSSTCNDCVLRSTLLDTFTTGKSHQQVEVSLPVERKKRRQEITLLLSSGKLNQRGSPQVLVTLEDITHRKQAEQALIRTERLATTGKLAASMAHEISNPLGAITDLLYIMGQSSKDAGTREYVELMEHQIQAIGRIADRTLKFHREDRPVAEFVLADLVGELLQLYQAEMRRKGLTLVKRVDCEARVVGSAGEIRQVISNLLLNAIEATPEGGRVGVRLYASSDRQNPGRRGFRLSVADTGSGIEAQHRSHIFEPFFTTKGEEGTGLGLWISSEIVKRAGGSLRVWSTPRPQRSGTCFSIFLPAEAAPSERPSLTCRVP
jgi:signal transduction histidine kinase